MLKIANQAHYYKQYASELVQYVKPLNLLQDYRLHIEDTQITLCAELSKQKACFTHSFIDPKLTRRANQKNQALIKACNNKKNNIKNVVDLTAGWGKDSFILASHGQQVDMVEHNPLLYHCLDYLLKTAGDESGNPALDNLKIRQGDSFELLNHSFSEQADCYYLDPMFPAHKSSAKPGKDLQLLQQLTENRSIEQTFRLCLQKGAQRVVVKRPLHAPSLDELKPDISYREKTIRFDVYLT